jgi:hypothetical protein
MSMPKSRLASLTTARVLFGPAKITCARRRTSPGPGSGSRAIVAAGTEWPTTSGDEVPRGRLLRPGEDVEDAALLDDAPGLHHGHAVADGLHHAHLMGDEQDRQVQPVPQAADQREDLLRRLGVQRAGRLVAEQEAGARGQRPRDAHALLLAARELRRDRRRASPPARPAEGSRPPARAARPGQPAISSGKATFSATVRRVCRLKCWNTMPMPRRAARSPVSSSASMSCPSTEMPPASGRSSRFTVRISVDFPAPERPTMPKISPARTSSETSSSATVPPAAKRLRRPPKAMAAGAMAVTSVAPGISRITDVISDLYRPREVISRAGQPCRIRSYSGCTPASRSRVWAPSKSRWI